MIQNVHILCTADTAFAVIEGDTFRMDVRISTDKGVARSLRDFANEQHKKANRLRREAVRAREAADWLEQQENRK